MGQSKDCTAASRMRFAHAPRCKWSEESPFVLLGLSAQPRGDTGLSPAEAVFGAPIVLSNEYLQNEEIFVDSIIKNFSTTLDVPFSSLPWHNSSVQLPSELPAELLSAPLVWVHGGDIVPHLQSLYDSPHAVLRHGPCSFTIRVGSQDEGIAVSRLKACTAADAEPGSPRFRGRLPGSCLGGPATTKRVSFSEPLVSSPSSSAPIRDGHGIIFSTRQGGFCTPGTSGTNTGSTDAEPVLSTGTAIEIRPLTSSPSSRGQSSGGALWRPAYTPGEWSNQSGVLW
jgi:hypothetical protein